MPTNALFAADGYDALGIKQVRWPGGDLPDTLGFQFVEGEYRAADEYDEFLAEPNGFTLRHDPAIAENLAGLEQVPFPPPTYFELVQPDQRGGALLGLLLCGRPSRACSPGRRRGGHAALGANWQEMAALGLPGTWGRLIRPSTWSPTGSLVAG